MLITHLIFLFILIEPWLPSSSTVLCCSVTRLILYSLFHLLNFYLLLTSHGLTYFLAYPLTYLDLHTNLLTYPLTYLRTLKTSVHVAAKRPLLAQPDVVSLLSCFGQVEKIKMFSGQVR